jgi:hypothetical protein
VYRKRTNSWHALLTTAATLLPQELSDGMQGWHAGNMPQVQLIVQHISERRQHMACTRLTGADGQNPGVGN